MTTLESIIVALQARLAGIRLANGYKTDAGADVRFGWFTRAIADFQEKQMLTIELGDDDPDPHTTNRYSCDQQMVIVYAIRAVDADLSSLTNAQYDIRKALLLPTDLHAAVSGISVHQSACSLTDDARYAFFAQLIVVTYQTDY